MSQQMQRKNRGMLIIEPENISRDRAQLPRGRELQTTQNGTSREKNPIATDMLLQASEGPGDQNSVLNRSHDNLRPSLSQDAHRLLKSANSRHLDAHKRLSA